MKDLIIDIYAYFTNGILSSAGIKYRTPINDSQRKIATAPSGYFLMGHRNQSTASESVAGGCSSWDFSRIVGCPSDPTAFRSSSVRSVAGFPFGSPWPITTAQQSSARNTRPDLPELSALCRSLQVTDAELLDGQSQIEPTNSTGGDILIQDPLNGRP